MLKKTGRSLLEHKKSSFDQEESNFARRVGELRAGLKLCDPLSLAERIGGVYTPTGDQTGTLLLSLWGRPVSIYIPEFIVQDENQQTPPLAIQALLLYYFQTAHGPAPAGKWISFSELPDGKFYNQAFQGYSGKQLSRAFGNNLTDLKQAALQIGSQWIESGGQELGDFTCLFQVLPRLPVLLVGWQGDEDFPASYQFLFDVTAANYLPTDVCAIVGGMLARKIIATRHI
jgi:hypothetical protein